MTFAMGGVPHTGPQQASTFCVSYSSFLQVISNLIVLWLEKMLDKISVFLNLLRLAL